MNFNLKISLNDDDYLDYNIFMNFKSPYGRKNIIVSRVLILLIFLIPIVVNLGYGGFTVHSFINIIPYLILLAVFQILFKPLWIWTLKGHITSMKKKGKLPYTEDAEIEFYDDCFVEIAKDSKSEIKYSVLERVSIVSDKVIYIHFNNAAALILPFSAFDSAEVKSKFTAFISEKCSNIDNY